MLGIDSSELLFVALVALVVIGPKDLPKAMRVVGYWVGRARGVARQFRQGFDTMVREAELEEMEKKWAAENARIMREHPAPPADTPSADPASFAGSGASGDQHPPVGTAPEPDSPPVMVERPVVEAAPEGTPPPRGDGVTS